MNLRRIWNGNPKRRLKLNIGVIQKRLLFKLWLFPYFLFLKIYLYLRINMLRWLDIFLPFKLQSKLKLPPILGIRKVVIFNHLLSLLLFLSSLMRNIRNGIEVRLMVRWLKHFNIRRRPRLISLTFLSRLSWRRVTSTVGWRTRPYFQLKIKIES